MRVSLRITEKDLEDLPEKESDPYNEDGFNEEGEQKINPYII